MNESTELKKDYSDIISKIPDYFWQPVLQQKAAIDKDGIVRDCVKDPDGGLFEIKNLIAFGNKVEL